MNQSMQDINSAITAAARCIESADALVILAGAGMGVDSGLPDYRGDEGLWRAYPRLKHLGLSFEDMANPAWFAKDPALAWGFYGHRQKLYRETAPHLGYTVLKSWGESMREGHFTYTSNVDGHFSLAGFDPHRLVECHGNIHRYQCSEPCTDRLWQEHPRDLDIDLHTLEARGELPRCPECNAIARPNVLMFFDLDWVRDTANEQLKRYNAWIDELRAKDARLAILEIGAGSSLPAIRRESELLLSTLNATLIRINPREAEGEEGTISIALPALKALEAIEAAL
jgi:NAD-dependent SIR2 family protein deacetylase